MTCWGWLFAVLVICQSPAALGEDGRLSVDMASASPRVRPNAPVTVFLKTFWNGSSIVEGHFEMRYFSGGVSLRSECTSHDIVLSPGEQTIRLTLPTPGSIVSYAQDELALKFVTADQTFDLKRYPLIFSQGERATNVCVVGPTDKTIQSDEEAELLDAFRLGDLLAAHLGPGSISTVHTRWDTIDVPEQPLHFCSFDVVLLRPEGFADLRKKQLDALLTWVRAGGSVGVMLPGELNGPHVEFLNELVAESFEPPFILNTSGEFTSVGEPANGVWRSHVELGRAAVIAIDELPKEREAAWLEARRVAGFLFKIRSDKRSSLNLSRAQLDQITKDRAAGTRANRRRLQLAWQPLNSTALFVSHLMPADVRVVPMSLIALLLLVYLVLIGPVDYYFLGYLKSRRYTWITFPLTTAFIAWLCVAMSDAFLSSNTTGKTLVVRDMGAQGEVLRETRFVLNFLPRRRQVKKEVSNQIFTPMDQERLTLNAQYAFQYQYAGQPTDPKYAGPIHGPHTK